jgi:hypothetical protein
VFLQPPTNFDISLVRGNSSRRPAPARPPPLPRPGHDTTPESTWNGQIRFRPIRRCDSLSPRNEPPRTPRRQLGMPPSRSRASIFPQTCTRHAARIFWPSHTLHLSFELCRGSRRRRDMKRGLHMPQLGLPWVDVPPSFKYPGADLTQPLSRSWNSQGNVVSHQKETTRHVCGPRRRIRRVPRNHDPGSSARPVPRRVLETSRLICAGKCITVGGR